MPTFIVSGVIATFEQIVDFYKKNISQTEDLTTVKNVREEHQVLQKIAKELELFIVDVGYYDGGEKHHPYRIGHLMKLTDSDDHIKKQSIVSNTFSITSDSIDKSKYGGLLLKEFHQESEIVEAYFNEVCTRVFVASE